MKNKPNLVICLEGTDGCGKTTQALLLQECIKHNNKNSIYTREPGGSPVGESLRNIFLNHFPELPVESQIVLLNLIRKVHIDYTILPALQENKIVILDRYLLSTFVYQGRGDKIISKHINIMHKSYINNFLPTLTLILNTNSKAALDRIKQRSHKNFLDKTITLEEHKKLTSLYLDAAKKYYKAPSIIIDANNSIIELHKDIIHTLNKELNINLIPLKYEKILEHLKTKQS